MVKSGKTISVSGLNKSTKALLVARTFKESNKSIIIISSDDRLAEEYEDDLDLLLGSDRINFFPDYEILPYEDRSPHYTIRSQRITALAKAVSSEKGIFSLSIRSFTRKLIPPNLFSKNIIILQRGKEYSPDTLISNLIGMGYQKEFQVSKIGEISRRGGIVDIFSPGTNRPVRIEFFGDEIESLRGFSISSQRSTGEELESITIYPSREFSLHDIETKEEIWEKIHKHGFYDGIEQDISLLFPRTVTFLEYFPADDVLILLDEPQYIHNYYQELLEEVVNLYQKQDQKKKRNNLIPSPADIYISEKVLNLLIKKNGNILLTSSFQEFSYCNQNLSSGFTSQENLNGNLDLLEKELIKNLDKGFDIFIQSDNKSQSKRMQDLLPDYFDKIEFSIGVFQRGFKLEDAGIIIYTDHEIFSRYKRKRRKTKFSTDEALVDYESLKPGDYIVHIDHGIGIYAGLKILNIEGNQIECLHLNYADKDSVYVPTFQLEMVSKFVSQEGVLPQIHKLGSKRWESTKKRAKKQIELIADDIIQLYAERTTRKGIAFDPDTIWQKEMEDSFIYQDTPDQSKATTEIKEDMETDTPMERLLCGDVGFGKTEVAIRAAFKAVLSGWQAAVLVPTTLLAEQHFIVFQERLAQYPIKITMLSRFRSPSQIKKDIEKLSRGEIDIAIGTHRLLSKDVSFKKLGLLIIDEEHRFGVRHKEKLRKLKTNVDTLYMSATPIPRTMYMALSRLKELSLIRTSPKERLPIRTVIVPYDKEVIKDAISREIDRGGQVFFVHNRVQTIESIATELRKLLPDVSFGIGHGQMPEKQLEKVTLDFAHHQFDVLISTTIIESGIDIPNVNTIIVNRSDTFGLAQLYQIRGRVGRSNRRAYAYLIIPPRFTEEARKRLETLSEYESLGSGYQIAMRDMEIRGVGALLGTKQSGIINTIGFNYYNRLLEEAVENLRKKKATLAEDSVNAYSSKRLQIESDFYFPAQYIEDEKERLNIYRKMLNFTKLSEFDELEHELSDRFGKIPEQAHNAIVYFKINLVVNNSCITSFQLKKNKLSLEFSSKNLPSRTKLENFLTMFNYPVSFKSVQNLWLIIELAPKEESNKQKLFKKSLEIVKYVSTW